MKKLWIVLGVVLLVLLMAYGWVKGTYNGFVAAQEDVGRAWADVESTYQRRSDLIPNLVETVKGYATHEKDVFLGVTEARSRVGQVKISADNLSPEAIQRFQEAQQGLSGALSRLLVVAERYPDLKANQNFLDLQAQLEGTENRINVARSRFNETARAYNTKVRSFPGNLLAGAFGFSPKPYFEAEKGAEKAPKVKF
ncbi:MAG: LemA family protein [Deltaproteobacteria bacterium]|nr:LemA family protein [Deltaproteobacteria bacterium]